MEVSQFPIDDENWPPHSIKQEKGEDLTKVSEIQPQTKPKQPLILIFCFQFDPNPWNVSDVTAFLYYICPECDDRIPYEDAFIQHAIAKHERVTSKLK